MHSKHLTINNHIAKKFKYTNNNLKHDEKHFENHEVIHHFGGKYLLRLHIQRNSIYIFDIPILPYYFINEKNTLYKHTQEHAL